MIRTALEHRTNHDQARAGVAELLHLTGMHFLAGHQPCPDLRPRVVDICLASTS
jgi:hypothetical protein